MTTTKIKLRLNQQQLELIARRNVLALLVTVITADTVLRKPLPVTLAQPCDDISWNI